MQKLAVPIAIVLSGGLIAVALYFISSNTTGSPIAIDNTEPQNIRGIVADDHVLGNPQAPIVLVEYSDTECPYCKEFHSTMHQVIDEYGTSGDVAWVYRHFPLTQIHPKAQREAEALECAAELGGNEGFWAYTDLLYDTTPSNNGLDLDVLPDLAEQVGLDRTAFEECYDSRRHRDSVQAEYQEAVAAGGRGTPFTVLLVDGEQIPIEGGQTYEVLSGLIDTLLATNASEGEDEPSEI